MTCCDSVLNLSESEKQPQVTRLMLNYTCIHNTHHAYRHTACGWSLLMLYLAFLSKWHKRLNESFWLKRRIIRALLWSQEILYWMHNNEAWLKLIMAFEDWVAPFHSLICSIATSDMRGIANDKVISQQLRKGRNMSVNTRREHSSLLNEYCCSVKIQNTATVSVSLHKQAIDSNGRGCAYVCHWMLSSIFGFR